MRDPDVDRPAAAHQHEGSGGGGDPQEGAAHLDERGSQATALRRQDGLLRRRERGDVLGREIGGVTEELLRRKPRAEDRVEQVALPLVEHGRRHVLAGHPHPVARRPLAVPLGPRSVIGHCLNPPSRSFLYLDTCTDMAVCATPSESSNLLRLQGCNPRSCRQRRPWHRPATSRDPRLHSELMVIRKQMVMLAPLTERPPVTSTSGAGRVRVVPQRIHLRDRPLLIA